MLKHKLKNKKINVLIYLFTLHIFFVSVALAQPTPTPVPTLTPVPTTQPTATPRLAVPTVSTYQFEHMSTAGSVALGYDALIYWGTLIVVFIAFMLAWHLIRLLVELLVARNSD